MHRGGFSYESWLQGMDFGSTHQLPGLPRQQRRAYVERALQQSPAVPSGEFLYANMGYAVAGAIAEQVMDEAWEDLMVRLLFQPLDMATAGFGAMGTARQIDQPWQHRGDRSQRQAIEPGSLSDNPAAIAPAGTVHASIDDWAKFIALHLQGELNNSTLLQPATIQKLHTPPQGEDYALGWLVTERDWGGGQVLTHAGSNTQNYAVVWMAPQRDFAVLVMTNQGGDWVFPAIDEAAWALIQQFLSSHP
jgi:CubicO group peptidase (beta-lactamase class C family)